MFTIFIIGLICLIIAGWLIGVATVNEGVKQAGLRNSLYAKSILIGIMGLILIILVLLKIIKNKSIVFTR
jgi:hypothetical protein